MNTRALPARNAEQTTILSTEEELPPWARALHDCVKKLDDTLNEVRDKLDSLDFQRIDVQVPTFDGKQGTKEEYREWEYAMDAYFRWVNLTESRKMRLLDVALRGKALVRWKKAPKGVRILSWETAKRILREEFGASSLFNDGFYSPRTWF